MEEHESGYANRQQWNDRYVEYMIDQAGVSEEFARHSARNANDSWHDGDMPEDAVYDELSCWEED